MVGERHARILDAVETLLGDGGTEAVTMRAVAAEAGTSLRLVQYYGRTKDELLTAALRRMADRSVERWRAARREGGGRTAEDAIRSFLVESLPTDEASRAFHRVGVSLEQLAITHPDRAAETYRRHLHAVREQLAEALLEEPRVSPDAARLLATEVMALGHGLGSLLMTGQVPAEEVEAVLASHLERLARHLDG